MYIDRRDEYIVPLSVGNHADSHCTCCSSPEEGRHFTRANALNVVDETSAMEKILKTLDIAEKAGRKKVYVYLEGTATEKESGISDSVVKFLDSYLGIIQTPRAIKGEIERAYTWTEIDALRKEYIPRIKELRQSGYLLTKMFIAHIALKDSRFRYWGMKKAGPFFTRVLKKKKLMLCSER